MDKSLDKIINKKIENPVLTQHQMNYQIDKLKCKSFLGPVKAYFLQRYYEIFYGYVLKEKK
ncbi:MAG: hypothetical protein AABY06_01750 [Nanoarchaeota archaeon]